ncbi:acyl-CoA N-acyltransferase [Eremomyces bilateralis CBS 781.70]|uniref:Acyl-CoA N-acyltransferase n=1 Tax=Eremomyces bilateralis CBS 781.70 TaxID=1392243 RepID=A0A6G1G2Y5_9PEZI|nr:acyl-CoA N-acyltransferase [Eremomyces bilateralis CBS 781.70]KAF1812169.1 acyl-CoA N-acyltransferase [Eremomyces bilateralis CBS 781.70]
MPIRYATHRDLDAISHIFTAAFWDEDYSGRFVHPYREQYPDSVLHYWRRKVRAAFWDYRNCLIVSVDQDGRITGAAEWGRVGRPSALGLKMGLGLGLSWWDPRRLVAPLVKVWNRIEEWMWPNRAAVPDRLDASSRAAPFFTRHLVGVRSDGWKLSTLGVHPDGHGKGYGRELVRWGLQKAQDEGISAGVITSDGSEQFYRKCGFDVELCKITEGENNPLSEVKGGVIFFKDPH